MGARSPSGTFGLAQYFGPVAPHPWLQHWKNGASIRNRRGSPPPKNRKWRPASANSGCQLPPPGGESTLALASRRASEILQLVGMKFAMQRPPAHADFFGRFGTVALRVFKCANN